MKIKCENVVRCGNRNCIHNTEGYYCRNTVISLDASGICAFRNSKPVKEYVRTDTPAQIKHNAAFDVEASK